MNESKLDLQPTASISGELAANADGEHAEEQEELHSGADPELAPQGQQAKSDSQSLPAVLSESTSLPAEPDVLVYILTTKDSSVQQALSALAKQVPVHAPIAPLLQAICHKTLLWMCAETGKV